MANSFYMDASALAKRYIPEKGSTQVDVNIGTGDHPEGRVQWRYHVAPVLLVRDAQGDVQEMTLDPILFDRPVSVKDWQDALHDTPTLVRTAIGEPGDSLAGRLLLYLFQQGINSLVQELAT